MDERTTDLARLADALPTLEQYAKAWKVAYYAATPGVTYEDVKEAARRVLTLRRCYEQAAGKSVRSDPDSTAQVASLVRSL